MGCECVDCGKSVVESLISSFFMRLQEPRPPITAGGGSVLQQGEENPGAQSEQSTGQEQKGAASGTNTNPVSQAKRNLLQQLQTLGAAAEQRAAAVRDLRSQLDDTASTSERRNLAARIATLEQSNTDGNSGDFTTVLEALRNIEALRKQAGYPADSMPSLHFSYLVTRAQAVAVRRAIASFALILSMR